MNSEKERLTRCGECVWFTGVDTIPQAAALHEKMMELFGDCLQKRDGACGVCRKITFSKDRPVLTNSNGYCHRAEPKENLI